MRIESSSDWKDKNTSKEKVTLAIERFFRECDFEIDREFHQSRVAILRDLKARMSKHHRTSPLTGRTFRCLLNPPTNSPEPPTDDITTSLTTGIVKELFNQSLKKSSLGDSEDEDYGHSYDSFKGRGPSKKVKRSDF